MCHSQPRHIRYVIYAVIVLLPLKNGMRETSMRWLKESKYHNRKVTVDGITFDSVKEASRWQELRMLERAGEITGLVRQQKIELIPKTKLYRACFYVCDFIYFDKRENKTIYEDVKGVRTKEYLLKRKLLYWRHGIEIKET